MQLHRLALACLLLLPGCASMPHRDPLQVSVAGIESLEGEGLEMRMMVKLRVQNPNDAPVDYNGMAVEVNVQGKTLATGVSDEAGSVPRFGETVVSIPVTVSAMRAVRQAMALMQSGGGPEKIRYEMKGKLNGKGFGATRFAVQGELDLAGKPEPVSD
jgi:LEA14-like dessication related protein